MRELTASTPPRPPVSEDPHPVKTELVLEDSASWLARTMDGYAEQHQIIRSLNKRLDKLEAEKEEAPGR